MRGVVRLRMRRWSGYLGHHVWTRLLGDGVKFSRDLAYCDQTVEQRGVADRLGDPAVYFGAVVAMAAGVASATIRV